MCLSPIQIPNPNYGRRDKMSRFCDVKSQYINVPCGHCTECVYMRQTSIVQRCIAEELDNHLFFCTLTYNDDSLPKLVCSNGVEIRYADMRDVVLMVKRLRRHGYTDRKISYLAVSELGSERGRPHFHLIFSVEKRSTDRYPEILNLEKLLFDAVLLEWRRNYGSTRNPDYRPLCTYVRKFIRGQLKSNYDLHYMNSASSDAGNSDVAFYVSKYMMKPSDRAVRLQQALKLNLDSDEYDSVWSVVKPRFQASTGFGLSSDVQRLYVRSCIDKSRECSDFPKFYSNVSSASFPLSRYYIRKGVYDVDDADFFLAKKDNPDDPIFIDDRARDVVLRKIDKLSKIQDVIDKNDMSFDLNSF